MAETKEVNSEIKNFTISDLKDPNTRVTTMSGYKVTILTTESNDPVYKIQGFIGKSTQLESWTTLGKYYAREKKKEKYQNINNLILIK